MEKQEIFQRVLKTIKKGKVMVKLEEDGVHIRLAGTEGEGEAFTLDWTKVYSLSNEKTNTYSFAETELDVLSKSSTDRPIIEPFRNEILALCEAFGNSGQSGGSAPYTASAITQAIKKLLLQEPICSITGINEEWAQVTYPDVEDEMMYQNKRCSALFKNKNGKCYYLDAIVKKTQTGNCWSGSFWLSKQDYLTGDKSKMVHCRQYIRSFPFIPKTFYIDVIEEEVAKDDWEMYLKDPKQLEKVFKYYKK